MDAFDRILVAIMVVGVVMMVVGVVGLVMIAGRWWEERMDERGAVVAAGKVARAACTQAADRIEAAVERAEALEEARRDSQSPPRR